MGNPELFARTLSIMDHPSDPMVMHFQLGFTDAFRARGFGVGALKAATQRLFAGHERLRSALVCEPADFRLVDAGVARAAELNERAWSLDGIGLDEFRQQMIPFEEAPLLRFKYVPGEMLYVACHHSLMDGFGCYELSLALMQELQSPGTALSVREIVPVRQPLLFRVARKWIMFRDHLRMVSEIGKNPTRLLAPARVSVGQRSCFLSREIAVSELGEIRQRVVRQGGRKPSVNDLIVSALHLAMEEVVAGAGSEGAAGAGASAVGRLSTLVPINMRPWVGTTPLFVNRMGYVSVSTLAEHRSEPATALARVHAEMGRAKRFHTEETVQSIMNLFESLGLLKLARKTWLKTRLPTRFTGPDKFFWKNMDTALVTNLGVLSFSEPYTGWISSIRGFVPVISPTVGLSVIAYREQVFFGLRFGSAVLSESAGERLLDAFLRRLRAMG